MKRSIDFSSAVIDRRNEAPSFEPVPASVVKDTARKIPRIPVQALKAPTGTMMPGRIMFVTNGPHGEWDIPLDVVSPGGIVIKTPDNEKKRHGYACFYGIVVRTGCFTHSAHTHMTPEELDKITKLYPLKPGTLILHTCAEPYHDAQDRTKFVTCDHLQALWGPDEVWPAHIEALRAKE